MGGQLHFLVERVSSFERERIVENSGKVNPRSRLLTANDSSHITCLKQKKKTKKSAISKVVVYMTCDN